MLRSFDGSRGKVAGSLAEAVLAVNLDTGTAQLQERDHDQREPIDLARLRARETT
jgi:hypothetical protein